MARLLVRACALSLAGVVGLGVVLSASGLLYLVRPIADVPGPAVADALPLDELSRHSAVPLLVFRAVWTAAATLLGGIARLARVERLSAGLILAAAVGLWCYIATAISILIVRQVAAEEAFRAAAAARSVYIPAALAGLAGALFGCNRRQTRPRAPILLATLTLGAGLLARYRCDPAGAQPNPARAAGARSPPARAVARRAARPGALLCGSRRRAAPPRLAGRGLSPRRLNGAARERFSD